MEKSEIVEKYAIDVGSATLKRVVVSSNGNEKKRFQGQLEKARANSSNRTIIKKSDERSKNKLKDGERLKREREIEKLHQVNLRLNNTYKLLAGVEKTSIIEIRDLLARLIQTSEKTEKKLRDFMEQTTNY